MKTLASVVLLAAAAAQAGTGTLTEGSSFNMGVWTGDKPVPGGSSDTFISLEKGGDWGVANDLGADGWLTVGGLAWNGAGALTITGDGFAFAGEAPTFTSNGKVTIEGPVRLDGNLTMRPQQEVELNGDLMGDGKFTLDSETCTDVHLRGKRTGNGETFIRRGRFHVYDVMSLGTGKISIDEPEYFDYKRLYLHGIPVVSNAFSLCFEGSVVGNWESIQVYEYSGETTFLGDIVYFGSKIHVGDGNRVYFDNAFRAASDNTYMVFQNSARADSYLMRANDFSDRLTLGLSGRLHLTVPGTTYRELWMYDGPTLVCDDENVMCPNREMGCLNSGAIELNGFSQTTGGYSVWGARDGATLRVINSNGAKTPTFTMVQGRDNPNAHMTFEGPMNLVKEGGAKLLIATATAIDGDLTVRDGKIKFGGNAGPNTRLAKTVTVTGGVLDLGGQTWSCEKLVMTGGTIQNGVLFCGATEVGGNVTILAELAGNVSVAPAAKTRLPVKPVSAGAYALPEGTVVYYPFNGSADEMLSDCGGGGYNLERGDGTPLFSSEGCNEGCLYVDGGTWLRAPVYPANMPKGAEPYTVVTWVRVDSGCSGSGGWVSYGGNRIPGGGNSFRFNGGDAVWNYWNDVDAGMEAPGIANGQWHQVVGTWDGTTRRLYYDGVLKNTDTRVPDIGTTDLLVGRTIYDSTMRGWIDDLLILNRAMSDEEVVANYRAGGVGRQEGEPTRVKIDAGEVELDVRRTSVLYRFDTADTLFVDETGNAPLRYDNPDQTTGAACDMNVTPGGPGGTLYLDGGTVLTSEKGFPRSMPTGMEPYTVCVWVRLAPDSSTMGGWFSYGDRETGHGNSFHAWGGFGALENYWNNIDMRDNLPNGARFDDGWHSLVCTYSGGITGRRTHYWDGQLWARYGEGDENYQPSIGNELFMVGTTMWSDVMKGWIDELAVYNYAFTPAEVANYHNTKVAPLVETAADKLDLEVGAEAVVSVPKGTAVQNLHGQGTVSGDIALAEGATLAADGGSVTVTGTLTIPEEVTVTLPQPCPRNEKWTLFAPNDLDGEANLKAWKIEGAPKGCGAEVKLEDGQVNIRVHAWGFSVYVR